MLCVHWTWVNVCISLTGLHVEQQVLAVRLGLLDLLLQLSSFSCREQDALFAVRQEVWHLGLQVIQDLLPLWRRLTTHLTGETQRGNVSTANKDIRIGEKTTKPQGKGASPCPGSIRRRSGCLWAGSARTPRSSCSHAADATETWPSGTAALPCTHKHTPGLRHFQFLILNWGENCSEKGTYCTNDQLNTLFYVKRAWSNTSWKHLWSVLYWK